MEYQGAIPSDWASKSVEGLIVYQHSRLLMGASFLDSHLVESAIYIFVFLG